MLKLEMTLQRDDVAAIAVVKQLALFPVIMRFFHGSGVIRPPTGRHR